MFSPLDLDLHFVLCDFGALGTAYAETVPTEVDRDTIIRNMMSGEYDHPLHVIAVNPAKGWARDVSEDIALGRNRGAGRPIITTGHAGLCGKSAWWCPG